MSSTLPPKHVAHRASHSATNDTVTQPPAHPLPNGRSPTVERNVFADAVHQRLNGSAPRDASSQDIRDLNQRMRDRLDGKPAQGHAGETACTDETFAHIQRIPEREGAHNEFVLTVPRKAGSDPSALVRLERSRDEMALHVLIEGSIRHATTAASPARLPDTEGPTETLHDASEPPAAPSPANPFVPPFQVYRPQQVFMAGLAEHLNDTHTEITLPDADNKGWLRASWLSAMIQSEPATLAGILRDRLRDTGPRPGPAYANHIAAITTLATRLQAGLREQGNGFLGTVGFRSAFAQSERAFKRLTLALATQKRERIYAEACDRYGPADTRAIKDLSLMDMFSMQAAVKNPLVAGSEEQIATFLDALAVTTAIVHGKDDVPERLIISTPAGSPLDKPVPSRSTQARTRHLNTHLTTVPVIRYTGDTITLQLPTMHGRRQDNGVPTAAAAAAVAKGASRKAPVDAPTPLVASPSAASKATPAIPVPPEPVTLRHADPVPPATRADSAAMVDDNLIKVNSFHAPTSNLDNFARNRLAITHPLVDMSARDHNCWQRAAWFVTFLQSDATTLETRLRARLADRLAMTPEAAYDAARKDEALVATTRGKRDLPLEQALRLSAAECSLENDVQEILEFARTMNRMTVLDRDRYGGGFNFGHLEGALSRVTFNLLMARKMESPNSALKHINLTDTVFGTGMGDDDEISVLLQELGVDLALLAEPTPEQQSESEVPFEFNRYLYLQTDKTSPVAAIDESAGSDAATGTGEALTRALTTTPIIYRNGPHFAVNVPAARFGVSPAGT